MSELNKQPTNSKKDEKPEEERVEKLKKLIFSDVEKKNSKVQQINSTGNFDIAKEEVPWYIILPSGQFRKIWDITIFFAVFYSIIIVPIDIGYNTECFIGPIVEGSTTNLIQILYQVLFVLLSLEILINCFTAIPDEKNNYVYKLDIILVSYLKSNLLMDLLIAFPWHLVQPFASVDCFQSYMAGSKKFYFVFFLRIMKLKQFSDLIEKMLKKYALGIRCIKFVLICLILPHIWGNILSGNSSTISSWSFNACSTFPPGPEFVACTKDILLKKIINIYVYSLYIGYYIGIGNDFTMMLSWETYAVLLIVVCSTIINAYIFGNIAVLLAAIGSDVSPLLQRKIDIMGEYMYFMKIDKTFIDQIEEYHLNLWFKQRTIMYSEDFFDDMTLSIRKMLLLDQWNKGFFEHSHFLSIVSAKFILDMIPLFKPKIYMKMDTIITEGDFKTEIFFIAKQGLCQVSISGEWVTNMANGEFFGEIAVFLRSRRRTSTVICLKDADFLKIEGDSFECLLKDYPNDALEIKKIAVSKLIGSMKLYPSGLFSKIVPGSNVKDYLFRKCLYLTNEEEDNFLIDPTLIGKDTLDQSTFSYKIEQLNQKLDQIKKTIVDDILAKEIGELKENASQKARMKKEEEL